MQSSSIQANYASSPSAAAEKNASTAPTSSAGSGIDPSNFMTLLMVQLTHQNPMEPMKDSEMMGQMAQLNSLQELQKMSLAINEMAMSNQASYAASLIGKTVRADDGESTTEGKVTGVSIEAGKMFVHVGDLSFPLDEIKEIVGEVAADE